jgi:hypothetical protein
MRVRGALPTLLVAACAAASAAPAAAEPVSGIHATLEQSFTTTKPGTPSGFTFHGRYHAAGDPGGPPPYMRKMVSYNTAGIRYDTSVPERCTASDIELAARGAAACPEGSKLGGGTTWTSFMGGPPQESEMELFNNANEQIILARSPLVVTVARGRIHPDGSVEFASPTCYPSVPGTTCPADTVLQLESKMTAPPYVRDGRSYMTTPARCPKSGSWLTPIRFWWANGTEETVVAAKPCSRPKAARRRR